MNDEIQPDRAEEPQFPTPDTGQAGPSATGAGPAPLETTPAAPAASEAAPTGEDATSAAAIGDVVVDEPEAAGTPVRRPRARRPRRKRGETEEAAAPEGAADVAAPVSAEPPAPESGAEPAAEPAARPGRRRRTESPLVVEPPFDVEPVLDADSELRVEPLLDGGLSGDLEPLLPAELAGVAATEGEAVDTGALDRGGLSAETVDDVTAELAEDETPISSGADVPEPDALPASGGTDAELSAEWLLLGIADREVVDAGEPIPLLRRDPFVADVVETAPAVEAVLVPEASTELPPPPELELPRRRGKKDAILPLNPEVLAEIRGISVEEARAQLAASEARGETLPRSDRSGRGGRPGKGGRPPVDAPEVQAPAAAPPPPAAPPGLVFVPEAFLESVPEGWLAEEPETEGVHLREAFPGVPGDRGRRRRRRGRDRRGGEDEEETVALEAAREPAVLKAAEAPVLDREKREPRDRAEPREQREYKEILVNVDDRETRIAVLENGRLVELHVEREERVVGNVCKGRVSNVLPGMDAAFVDIGLERNAFLYVGDILFDDPRGGSGGSGGGNGDSPARRTSRDVRIKDLAKPGQEILVQIVKGPRGTKGARVSTKMSIPGRYLVLMPEGDHQGVSRKIMDAKERDRLRRIAEQLQPKGFGLIVRTEAEGRTEQELRQDLDYLQNTWKNIQEKTKRAPAPALIHKDLGIVLKTIRDLFGSDVDKLVIDDQEEYEKISETLAELAPDLADRVQFYDEAEPLFVKYHIEEEIDRLLRRKVWLRNGAYLLIDTTEALTTIDVNTGKFVGTSSLAETILKTNLDAVDEIARQLRLRDIGGMIVLDFIDMSAARDRALVMKALENAFKKDRTRTKIAHISPLGLVEMTRKRTAESVTDVMTQSCPYCQGRGRVWSPETMAIQIEREMMRRCAQEEIDALLIYANPEVAAHLIGAEGESVERLERLLRRPIYIRARQDFHVEKYEMLPGDMLELERQMFPFHGGQVVDAQVTKIELITPPRSAAWADGYFVDLANGSRFQDQRIRVRLTDVRRSFALGEPVAPPTAVDRSEPI